MWTVIQTMKAVLFLLEMMKTGNSFQKTIPVTMMMEIMVTVTKTMRMMKWHQRSP